MVVNKARGERGGGMGVGFARKARKFKGVSFLQECICGNKEVARISEVIEGETLEILAHDRCKPIRPLFRIECCGGHLP